MITLQCDRCGYKVELMPNCGDTIPFRYSDYKFYCTEVPRKKEMFLSEEYNKKLNEWLNQAGKEESEDD